MPQKHAKVLAVKQYRRAVYFPGNVVQKKQIHIIGEIHKIEKYDSTPEHKDKDTFDE